MNRCGGIKDDEMYIFVGDYIDRGIENAEVIAFLMSIKDYAWVKKLHDLTDKESIPKDICTLRKMFYQEMGNLNY